MTSLRSVLHAGACTSWEHERWCLWSLWCCWNNSTPSLISPTTALTWKVILPESVVLSVKLTLHMKVFSRSLVISSGIKFYLGYQQQGYQLPFLWVAELAVQTEWNPCHPSHLRQVWITWTYMNLWFRKYNKNHMLRKKSTATVSEWPLSGHSNGATARISALVWITMTLSCLHTFFSCIVPP